MRNVEGQATVNTLVVKMLKVIKKTMQGGKVDPGDDQSGKDQSDLFDRDSSDSVLSRSSEFRKSRSKSRTGKEQSKTVPQDRITQRIVEQDVNMHAQHDVHTVKMEQSKIIKKHRAQKESDHPRGAQSGEQAGRVHQPRVDFSGAVHRRDCQ